MAKLTKMMHSVAIFDRLYVRCHQKISNDYVIENDRSTLEMEQSMHFVSNNMHRNNLKTLVVAASLLISYF